MSYFALSLLSVLIVIEGSGWGQAAKGAYSSHGVGGLRGQEEFLLSPHSTDTYAT